MNNLAPVSKFIFSLIYNRETYFKMDALLEFWFDPANEHVWFTPTEEDDKHITTSFGYLIERFLFHTDPTPTDPNELLTCILVFDQVSRHVSRFFEKPYPQYHQALARAYTFEALTLYPDLEPFTEKQIPFVLLPYRHAKSTIYVNYVKDLSLRLLETTYPNSSYIRRFYQATIRQIGRQTIPHPAPSELTHQQHVELHKILDPESVQSITEPKGPPPKHDLLQALRASIPADPSPKHKAKHKPWRMKRDPPTILLSVSGGKDSMALATALAYIHKESPTRFKLQAVHINYMNRPTSNAEENLVIYYVNHILKIPLYIRRIQEIRRSRTSKERKFYESVTREARFRTYHQIDPTAFIVLGHNSDDTIENVITNITKKKHYDNLLGMKTFSVHSPTKTQIWRPLLSISKRQIEDFNRATLTPFTYDSTPSWSDRGKLRDSVVPSLTDFNPAILEGLAQLSKTLGHLSQIYETYALPQILETRLTITETHFYLKYDEDTMTEKVMRDIFSHLKIPQPSHKSLSNLITVLNRATSPPKTVLLTKDYHITITGDKRLALPKTS